MMLDLFLPRPEATEALGAKLARNLSAGDTLALHGDLGAGKTTLVRGLIRALAPETGEVPSPTYTLVQTYETPIGLVWHFDLYRLEKPADLIELGWDDAANGVRLIEWPERAGAAIPKHRLDLHLLHDAQGRRARLEPASEHWQERLYDF